MIKFQQSQALTSHFESFWSIVEYSLNVYSFLTLNLWRCKPKTLSHHPTTILGGCLNRKDKNNAEASTTFILEDSYGLSQKIKVPTLLYTTTSIQTCHQHHYYIHNPWNSWLKRDKGKWFRKMNYNDVKSFWQHRLVFMTLNEQTFSNACWIWNQFVIFGMRKSQKCKSFIKYQKPLTS